MQVDPQCGGGRVGGNGDLLARRHSALREGVGWTPGLPGSPFRCASEAGWPLAAPMQLATSAATSTGCSSAILLAHRPLSALGALLGQLAACIAKGMSLPRGLNERCSAAPSAAANNIS